jgi:hypothetical protein
VQGKVARKTRGSLRLAAVQIWFAGGARRDYLIGHRGATGGFGPSTPSSLVGTLPGIRHCRGTGLAEAN